jgi:hypothetical protein
VFYGGNGSKTSNFETAPLEFIQDFVKKCNTHAKERGKCNNMQKLPGTGPVESLLPEMGLEFAPCGEGILSSLQFNPLGIISYMSLFQNSGPIS